MIKKFKNKKPEISDSSYVDENANIVGDVILDENTSVWPFASIRGDKGKIYIGKNTNIQDCAVIHNPTYIGDGVSIGHSALVHGAKIRNNVLIGMGSIILDNAEIGENCIVGAGALVTGGKKFEANSLILGSPAKAIRKLTEKEIDSIRENAQVYNELRLDYKY